MDEREREKRERERRKGTEMRRKQWRERKRGAVEKKKERTFKDVNAPKVEGNSQKQLAATPKAWRDFQV